ncbi:MAG TPA: TetR/AcrR family transcriptional regulator [Solirubrobacteraceae bacterium]
MTNPAADPDPDRCLPLVGGRGERGDAAANRERVLCAARRLFVANGPAAVSMDAVAAAAGVGKGTVFRRFGDRAGLCAALLDEGMRGFQEAFLSGPPPLGPGAPAGQRLDAFLTELVALLDRELDLVLAIDQWPRGGDARPLGSLALHLRVLLTELDPSLDAEVGAEMLLGAVNAGVIARLRRQRGVRVSELQDSIRRLARGLSPETVSRHSAADGARQ